MNRIEEKIYNGEELTDEELDYVACYASVVDESCERVNKDKEKCKIVFQIKDRFFALEWTRGYVLFSPNEFCEQPYEVEVKTEKKMIEVETKEYIRK